MVTCARSQPLITCLRLYRRHIRGSRFPFAGAAGLGLFEQKYFEEALQAHGLGCYVCGEDSGDPKGRCLTVTFHCWMAGVKMRQQNYNRAMAEKEWLSTHTAWHRLCRGFFVPFSISFSFLSAFPQSSFGLTGKRKEETGCILSTEDVDMYGKIPDKLKIAVAASLLLWNISSMCHVPLYRNDGSRTAIFGSYRLTFEKSSASARCYRKFRPDMEKKKKKKRL